MKSNLCGKEIYMHVFFYDSVWVIPELIHIPLHGWQAGNPGGEGGGWSRGSGNSGGRGVQARKFFFRGHF